MSNAAATPHRDPAPIFAAELLSAGDVLIDLAARPDADGTFTPPSIIKIAPRGKTKTRDDRAFDFRPEALVARFDADGIDVAIDIEHALSSFMGEKSAGAAGWISKLEARADGLYAHVDWLQPALNVLKARSHRYVSPTFRHDEFGVATWLHSVALVAAPALANMPALAAAQLTETAPMPFAKLAAELGLTTDASEDAMVVALKAKLDGMVDKAVHDAALDKLKSATDDLNALKTADRKEKLNALIEGALTDKKITPAEREHYEKLAATDEGFAQVKALFEAMPAKLAASAIEGQETPDSKASLSAEDRTIMAQMGLTEDEYRAANDLKAD